MRAYLIRHGQSEENTADFRRAVDIEEFRGFIAASRHSPLTELGYEQARAAAGRLAESAVTHLYASPYLRAQQTAAVIGERLGLPVITVDELREVHPLVPPLLRRGRLRSFRSLFIRGHLHQFWPGRIERGETWWHATRRIADLWTRLSDEWLPSSGAAIVSHQMFIRTSLRHLARRPGWRVVARDFNNAGISTVEQI